jgi:hypothetical protein
MLEMAAGWAEEQEKRLEILEPWWISLLCELCVFLERKNFVGKIARGRTVQGACLLLQPFASGVV